MGFRKRLGLVKGKLLLVWLYVAKVWFSLVPRIFRLVNLFWPKEVTPPIEDDILLQSATSLAAKIRSRELSSENVIRAYIQRCLDVNPLINAIVEDDFVNAIKKAKAIDQQIFDGTAPDAEQAPFLGVPFSVKNCVLTNGMGCSVGMVCRKNKRATEDAAVVENMKRAGAVPLTTTNVSETCMWWETFNRLHGRTKNPYDTRRSAGGSSGGEGALIGAAGSVIGIGTDAAGSIRIPAFINGIFGHKPTAHVVNVKGAHAHIREHQSDLFVVGPMCRYAEDLAPMLAVMAGPTNAGYFCRRINLSKLRIFYMYDICPLYSSSVDGKIKDAMRKAMHYFAVKYGALRIKLDLTFVHYALPILINSFNDPQVPTFTEILCHCDGTMNPKWEYLKLLLGRSTHTLAVCSLAFFEHMKSDMVDVEGHRALTRMRELLLRQLDELLGDDGVLFMAPIPNVAPFHHQAYLTPMDCIYSSFINPLGLPSTACPLGLDDDGIPLGVQIIGATNRDYLTIAVAAELEKVFGGWREPGKKQH